jgi:hypothetical protein
MKPSRFVVAAFLTLMCLVSPKGVDPARADSSTQLPFSGFGDMVVDPVHQRVFVTGSLADNTIQVLDFNGTIIASIPNEAGWGMALDSSTSTLFVAITSANTIDKISTNSLLKTGTIPVVGLFPDLLAIAGGRLWFGHECFTTHAGLASIRFNGTGLKTYSGANFPKDCAALATTPTNTNLLVTADLGLTPTTVWEYNVATNPPTLLATAFNPGGDTGGLNDMHISPDGSSLLAATFTPDNLQEFRMSDLTLTGTYEGGPGNDAAIYTGDGSFVAGAINDIQVWTQPYQAFVFEHGNSTATSTFDLGERYVYPRGLLFSPDSTKLFAVTTDLSVPIFHVIDGPTLDPSTLTLAASPNPVYIEEPVTLSGTLVFPLGGSTAGKTIHLDRLNGDGSTTILPDVITDSFGNYAAADTLVTIGSYTYSASWDGDSNHRPASASQDEEAIAHPATTADFNGDGYADLAVGVPGESVGSVAGAGAVNVIYGSATGLDATDDQLWTQDSTDVLDSAESGDAFGFAVATGDFNRDGFADLAVGVPGEDIISTVDAGAVNVLYGSSTGLTAASNQFWYQDGSFILDFYEAGDLFGYSIAAGDVNGDGFADLSIGVPAEDIGTTVDAGMVNQIMGSDSGLTSTGNQVWSQGAVGEINEDFDDFAFSLALGDFNADGYADLAVGAPFEDVGSVVDAGAVNVIFGSATGLVATGSQYWNQDTTDINDTAETGDAFGFSVATGDITGDGYSDLATGVPFEDVGSVVDAGGVSLIYGSSAGLSSTSDQFRTQNSPSILDSAETFDNFGFAVAIGDFDGDGFWDVASGVPGEDLAATDGGAVNVIYGASTGVTSTGNQFWNQDSTDINDKVEKGDQYAYTVIADQFGNGPEADLVAGVPFEDLGTGTDAGAVSVIYGSPSNLTSVGDDFWNQNSTGIEDTAETGDEFGFGLGLAPGGGPRPPG